MEILAQPTREQISNKDEPGLLSREADRFSPTLEITLTKDDMTVWTWLVSKGIANALSGLSEMVGHEIRVTYLDIKRLPAKDAAVLLEGTDAPGVGIYLSIDGDATGHLLLMYDPRMAFQLVDLQLDLPPGSTQELGEMERCALGDIGNITGTFFLNTLADSANLILMPSPPVVIVDTVRAIMNVPLGFIMKKQEDALVVKAAFSTDNRQIDGAFMILPTMDFMKTILKNASIQ